MCHYQATKEDFSVLQPKGMYLVDSGGQYYEGTTDITRTIVVGPLTEEEKEHFTITAMGTPASWKRKISPWMHRHQPRLPRKTGILGERS